MWIICKLLLYQWISHEEVVSHSKWSNDTVSSTTVHIVFIDSVVGLYISDGSPKEQTRQTNTHLYPLCSLRLANLSIKTRTTRTSPFPIGTINSPEKKTNFFSFQLSFLSLSLFIFFLFRKICGEEWRRRAEQLHQLLLRRRRRTMPTNPLIIYHSATAISTIPTLRWSPSGSLLSPSSDSPPRYSAPPVSESLFI